MTFATTLKTLLYLRWKRFVRSSYFRLNLVTRIFVGLMGLYLLFNFIFVGYILDVIVRSIHPEQETTRLINQYIFYFFGILFVVRMLLQKLPSAQLSPCLHLPFRKSNLVFSYLSLYLLNGLNHIPILMTVPYWLKAIVPQYSLQSSLLWLIGFCFVAFSLNFLVLRTKILLVDRTGRFLFLIAFLAGIAWLDHTMEAGLLVSASSWLFEGLLNRSALYFLVPASLVLLSAASAYSTVRRHLSLDHGSVQKRERLRLIRFDTSYTAEPLFALLSLEWKLLTRNKTTRALLIAGLINLVLGLFLIVNASHRAFVKPTMGVFCLLPLGAFLILPYSASVFSSEGRYFDGILARNISFVRYVDTKLLFVAILALLIFALNLTVFYLTSEILRWLLSALFFHVLGVVALTGIYHALYNTKAARINGSLWEVNSFQGKVVHFILRLLLVYYPTALLYLVYEEDVTINDKFFPVMSMIGIPGLMSLLMIMFWRKAMTKKLSERKYIMAEGFRKK